MRPGTLERRLIVLAKRREGVSNLTIAQQMGLTESQVSSDLYSLRCLGYDVPRYRSGNRKPVTDATLLTRRKLTCQRCGEDMRAATPEMICGFCLEEEEAA